MIRKFSTTNSTQLLSAEEQQHLAHLSRSARGANLRDDSVAIASSNQHVGSRQYASTRSTSTSTSKARDIYAGDYAELYMLQTDDDDSDEGLSMSEDDDRLGSNSKEFTSKLLEEMTAEEQLISAAQLGQGQLVKTLLMQGVPVTIDQNGTTAIHQAAEGGFAEVIRILLDHGVDIDLPDSGGYTALHKAAAKGHLCVLGLLINEGCDIDIQDDTYGNTSLHEAAWNGWSKSVDLLLKNKSNAFIANRAGCTALHLAAQSGHNQSGRALLYAGCSPDVKNNYGDTPLHTAARYGHAGIARILISARCSISVQNKNGDTSLHIAAAFKRRKIAKLLVEGGINIRLSNKQEETAVDIARRKEHLSIIEIIHQGHAEPTNGVRLSYSMDNSRTTQSSQYSQQAGSRETTPDARDSKKKSTGLVSWIKRKFAKEKIEKERSAKSGLNATKSLDFTDGNQGLFSQYVRKQGFVSYRDLAGNVRQGPVGYVPNCQCEVSRLNPGMDTHVPHTHYQQMSSKERMRELDIYANHRMRGGEMTAEERIKAEKQECIDRLKRLSVQERNISSKQLEEAENLLREDLHSWLATQISDTRESDPFGYSVGSKQQRFGDDFDHERIARYETMNSENVLPPPRLFRSRSDETLSHSEYNFHGRAFKSREAAMEELKTLKHHEEIRERRKLIRAGVQLEPSINTKIENAQTVDNETYKTIEDNKKLISGLWMSRENLDEGFSRIDAGGESPTAPPNDHIHNARSHINQRSESFAAKSPSNRPPVERVVGRRESGSTSPERKTDEKAAMPLKSAMRQPRSSDRLGNSKTQLYRSSSLPRDSKVAFKIEDSSEERKPVKSVRYDDSVKSPRTTENRLTSLSSPQAEQVLFPGKREAPIGGHDEKFSESSRPPLPSYQSTSSFRHTSTPPFSSVNHKQLYSDVNSNDLRDTIVNTRNELLARNKSDVMKSADIHTRNQLIPIFEDPNKNSPNISHQSMSNVLPSRPKFSSSSDPSSNYYRSQETPRQPAPRQVPLPFSHYANGNVQHVRQLSQPITVGPTSQQYSTSSLPRPQRRATSTSQVGIQRRVPLPSYDEIQSSRSTRSPQHPPPSYVKTATNFSNSKPILHNNAHQLCNSEQSGTKPERNKLSKTQRRTSFRESPNDQTAIVDSTSVCSSSNLDSGYSGNFYDGNTNGSPTEKSWYQQSIQSAALKMTAAQMMNNQRNKNPNFTQPNSFAQSSTTSNTAVAHQPTGNGAMFNGQITNGIPAYDASSRTANRAPNYTTPNSAVRKNPSFHDGYLYGAMPNGAPMNGITDNRVGSINGPIIPLPKRTVYSNMTSDV